MIKYVISFKFHAMNIEGILFYIEPNKVNLTTKVENATIYNTIEDAQKVVDTHIRKCNVLADTFRINGKQTIQFVSSDYYIANLAVITVINILKESKIKEANIYEMLEIMNYRANIIEIETVESGSESIPIGFTEAGLEIARKIDMYD